MVMHRSFYRRLVDLLNDLLRIVDQEYTYLSFIWFFLSKERTVPTWVSSLDQCRLNPPFEREPLVQVMTLKVYLLSSWGAGLSSVLYSFKSCDFSCGPFCKIQESLGLI
jgi:hypothetical protein